ncbi:uncharacterized protein LOC110821539 isoform X2 [Carica papaya]|uniref:uncharacterized protein LOC110821539 isoform X2 n=1 Tax=Carica papaya TaxID=3649 RepID=UPI000B8CFEBC|nr:uncharacterized protein LOC110821539 isoform X2 [Carica papaya]
MFIRRPTWMVNKNKKCEASTDFSFYELTNMNKIEKKKEKEKLVCLIQRKKDQISKKFLWFSLKNYAARSHAVVSGWILTRDRKLLDVFPKSLRHLWNDWELRTSVLVSLSIQIILILLGNRRKYNATNCIRLILWLAYLLADWIATVSLGILANNYENDVLKAFWAPFLLLHLGGPDTITAYSLEDNELWLRHLLELVFQSGVVFYVVLKSWTSSWFNFLTVPVFVAGLIKYGERIWVLRSASIDHFGESMRPPPDPGPNYAKFMDDYASRKAEGFKPSLGTVIEDPTDTHQFATVASNSLVQDAVILQHAYSFYGTFRRLFADLILSFQDRDGSQKIFRSYLVTMLSG